ncbi:MAG: hypothetical protein WC797_04955, partial [Candidatus Paceibacterota bacterium]
LPNPVTASLTVNGQHPTVTSPLLITPTEATTPVTMGWSSTNATSCTASGSPASPWVGTKGINGSEPSVGLSAGTNYALTITCNGEGSATATDTVYVNVGSLPSYTWALPSDATITPSEDPTNYKITATFSAPGFKIVTVSKGSPVASSCTPNVNVHNRSIPGDIQEI